MTAPSLLDELEGVVRLAEKATPGEWTATVGHDVKQQHGVTVMKAWAGRGPQQEHNAAYVVALVNWFRAHHAELADMAKRLEAAERDARRWRHVRSTAFREFELDHVWLRFAAIEQFDGPIHPLTEAWIDESVDRRIAAAQEGAG